MQYLIPLMFSFSISLGLTYLVKFLAVKYNWAISKPRERDIHKKPIPRLGGIAIFVTFWFVVCVYLIFFKDKLNFIDEEIFNIDKNLFGVFIASTILFGVGLYDDIKGLNAWIKLFFQIFAGLIIVYFGINIWGIPNPFTGEFINFHNWTYLIVPMWIVLIVNVVNWLDGIDGLASGTSFITLIVLLILAQSSFVHQPATALICAILAGAVIGFLPFNFNPAKIFLGDSGSMFLGLMIAVTSIISGGKIATVALVLGIPILDALWVISRRIISGKSPMKADKYHLHHRFLEAGFSQKQTVIIMYSMCALFGIIALLSGTEGKVTASLWLLGIIIIMGIGLIYLKNRRKNNV